MPAAARNGRSGSVTDIEDAALELLPFMGAVAALLLTPGPTNTLVALAGAARGFKGAAPSVLAETAAYAANVAVIAWTAAPMLQGNPDMRRMLALLGGGFVLFLAVRLWRGAGSRPASAATPSSVFVATLLNPKALVFGLVLLPTAGPEHLPARYAVFLMLVLASGVAWAAFGSLLRGRSPAVSLQRLPVLSRAGALAMAAAGVSVLAAA
jgi:threonine/homoserine/homoserine lactone efflux protein